MIDVLAEVQAELERSNAKHRAFFYSAHEGFSVLKEEVDELWDEVKAQERDMVRMRKEALQVAAMAVKFIASVCDRPFDDAETES
jgi:NTP pyrophosphatase (non-canonical NTP hydrolase)